MNNESFTFDDVLIVPKFSKVESRKDVDLSVKKLGLDLKLPIISANMDTITDSKMCVAMAKAGATGCLHRFWDLETNVDEFKEVFHGAGYQAMSSVGLGDSELDRADALVNSGCTSLIVDVANGASLSVVKQVKKLRELFGNDVFITVGNFATSESVKTFLEYEGRVDGIKIGVGPGSRCQTREVTGVGYPQLSAIIEVSKLLRNTDLTIIADGGMNKVADCAKALGAGAHILMSGSFFAGTEESPGELYYVDGMGKYVKPDTFLARKMNLDGTYTLIKDEYSESFKKVKKYRGSASKESYEIQGKISNYRTPEGDSVYIKYKGYVADVLQDINGGLRSAFTYCNSRTLEEFHKNVEFIRVSSNTVMENGTRNGVK